MKVVILGSNGLVPSDEGGQTACYMIPEHGIVLDAGSGLYRLGRYLQTDFLDIYLSHEHRDHTWGLLYLFNSVWRADALKNASDSDAWKIAFSNATEFTSHVRIHSTRDTQDGLQKDLVIQDVIQNRKYQLLELESSETLPAGGTITYFPLEHPVPCSGFRLDWPGHSLAYVTDTTAKPDATYIEHIRGVDVLLHERHFADELIEAERRSGHSRTTPVAHLAAAAEVGRLIFIHCDSIHESEIAKARSIFPTTGAGYDGMEIEF